MHLPSVKLKSGGYIVINQTEALVAIDVNSGRATKERNIEETALSTNIEAAEEVARQLKLRDLSGLIVIDFIDMEGYKNQHSVEKKLKEAMSSDRARIQIGRISHFGLLELSRQRLRPSVSENYFSTCDTCGGTGVVRSVESSALRVLRKIEDTNIRNELLNVFVPSKIGMYILNHKRKSISEIEEKLNISINFQFDDQDNDPDCKIEKKGPFKIAELSEVKNFSEKLEEEQEQKNETKKIKKNSWKKTRTTNINKKDNQELINKNEEKISNLDINLKDKDKKDAIAKKKMEKGDKNSLKKISKENVKGKNKIKVSKTNKQIEEKETNSKNKKSNPSSTKNEPLNKKNGSTNDKSKKTVKEKKRVSKASQPLKVVNVDEVKEAKKGGWWSQAK